MSFEMRPLDLEVFRVLLCRGSAVRDQYRTHSGEFLLLSGIHWHAGLIQQEKV
jgi:hypothetical protein